MAKSARIGFTARRELAVGVIGCGRLGASLARGMTSAGYRVTALAGRGSGRAEALARAIPGASALSAEDVVRESDLVLLAVPDATVAALAATLPWRRGQAAVHCAGALDLAPLAPLAASGVALGCLHPLQAFPDPAGSPERLRGIAVGVEAAEEDGSDLGALLEALAADLGAERTLRLEGIDRACYHAAAVLASNDVVALAAAAARAWALAGLPVQEAPRALGPLLAGAASARPSPGSRRFGRSTPRLGANCSRSTSRIRPTPPPRSRPSSPRRRSGRPRRPAPVPPPGTGRRRHAACAGRACDRRDRADGGDGDRQRLA